MSGSLMCCQSVGDHDLNHELNQSEQRDHSGAVFLGTLFTMSHALSCHASLDESRAVNSTLLEHCDAGCCPWLIFVVT